MKTKKQLTDRQKKIHARNKAMGPAMIVRPLRVIADHHFTIGKDFNGEPIKVFGRTYKKARIAADRGNGALVRDAAFDCLLMS